MDLSNSISTSKANLSLDELESLAAEIRQILIQNNGLTIPEYVKRAEEVTHLELGYRLCKAICFEPKLLAYFPDEVYDTLYRRFTAIQHYRFNESDMRFMKEHAHKGTAWIANRMYTSTESINDVSRREDIHITTLHDKYTPDVVHFIATHADKGHHWIADELNLSHDAIRHKMERMGIWKKEVKQESVS